MNGSTAYTVAAVWLMMPSCIARNSWVSAMLASPLSRSGAPRTAAMLPSKLWSEKGVRLALKMPVGPCIPVGIEL